MSESGEHKREPFWATILTEDKANTIWDPLRIAFAGTLGMGLLLAAYAVVGKGQAFDPQGFGLGFGGLLTGAGAGIFFHSRSS